jgi:hypothetical protein
MFPICSKLEHRTADCLKTRSALLGGCGMQEDQNWHRRQAIQVVAQLPEGTADALRVLELARELVEGFLMGQDRAPLAEVLPFPAASNSR